MKGIAGKKMVIGNWKMNPITLSSAQNLAREVSRHTRGAHASGVDVGIAVPTLYIPTLSKITKGKWIMLGAQDALQGSAGSETGGVSFGMLKEFHIAFSILGHSECRARGESDGQIKEKLIGALAVGVTPIVCVGETTRDDRGDFYTIVLKQIDEIFSSVQAHKATRIVIAYEPVWAIGTKQTPIPDHVSEMRLVIKKHLTEKFGITIARKIRVLYGGSVDEENASMFMRDGMIDGFLVGSASLDPVRFAGIVHAVSAA